MANKIKNYAIVAAGSFMLVCFMAGNGFAWHPDHNNYGPGFGYYHMTQKGGPHFDKYLVDKGVPAATVNAYVVDKNKFRAETGDAFDAMRAKGLELYEEMMKAAPNADKARALQAELSKMRTDLDAKHLEHQLYLKLTYPQVCEIMQNDFYNKGFGPGKPGPGYYHNGPNGRPGPGFHHNGPRP